MTHLTRRTAMAGGMIALGGLLFAASLALDAGAPARAGAPVHINADADGLALYGYDPVAYFNAGKPTPGDAAITLEHDGAIYRFQSTANRDAFSADPAKYLPAYGGYCAYGLSQGYKVKVDPEVWRIVDGRLYLNYDRSVGETWAKDIPGYIAKADANWPGLRDKPRAD